MFFERLERCSKQLENFFEIQANKSGQTNVLISTNLLILFNMESLILAQDERWRQA